MNFINSVDTDVFNVDNAGKLTLTAVSSSALVPVLGNLNLLPHSADNFTLVDEINNIYDILSWSEIENSI